MFCVENKSTTDFPAHITYKGSKQTVQSVKSHLLHTAEYCADPLTKIGLSSCGRLAGLCHDLGKYTIRFKYYLSESVAAEREGNKRVQSKKKVVHTFQGVKYILERFHCGDPIHMVTAELIAYAIGAHHGLFDCVSPALENGFLHRVDFDDGLMDYQEALDNFHKEFSPDYIATLFEECVKEVSLALEKNRETSEVLLSKNTTNLVPYQTFQLNMVARAILSSLIYADRRDTAEFEEGSDLGDIPLNIDKDIKTFEVKYASLPQDTEINLIRRKISEQCKEFGIKSKAGIYRLDVKTGGGKTLSALRMQLHHAKVRGLDRIINVTPLLSIIDQNADDIKAFLPEETVLEHHSDVINEGRTQEEIDSYSSMIDRWNAPVIITSLVQFLEILFGKKAGQIARMRALFNSCIVIDETQTVPIKLQSLFTAALNFLKDFCGCTIFISTATQPAFERMQYPLGVSEEEIVTLEEREERIFSRCRYHFMNGGLPFTYEHLAEFVWETAKQGEPLLIICNTKKQARKIFSKLKSCKSKGVTVLHLSAKMCKAHRADVIKAIKEKLKEIHDGNSQETLIVVSTQVVEAGINFSFRHVVRIIAGCDSLVQAGGRCNRSWEYSVGDVYLVNLEDNDLTWLIDIKNGKSALLGELISNVFKTGVNGSETSNMLFNPEKPEFINRYYTRLYHSYVKDGGTMFPITMKGGPTTIGALLSGQDTKLRREARRAGFILDAPFLTVAEAFRIFENDARTVLVPYKDGIEICDQIRKLDKKGLRIPENLIRKASAYSISLFEYEVKELSSHGMIREVAGARIFILDEKAYDLGIGCDTEAEYATEDFFL